MKTPENAARRALAIEAEVAEMTVRRFEDGLPIRFGSRLRIERALERRHRIEERASRRRKDQ